ncbi:MAG TPA: cytochrome C oxidase subunit II [Paenibacillaceae bacterium]|nr:cytochrome C oxidase subunit II [Paenibacillaceae bacterium]
MNIDIPRLEKIWLWIGGAMIVVFLAIIGFMGLSMGLHPPGQMRTLAPELVDTTAPFNTPGLVPIGTNEYRATVVSRIWTFQPNNMTIPVGSTVHFEVTSPDVVHGLYIPGTNVNIMAVPGHITEYTYTFKKPGEYLVLCHEYCGTGHQNMMGKVTVQ